jgi:hypothetical protein
MHVEVCPLPQGLPQSAQTHEGSGIDSDEAVIVPITNPDNTIIVIITGYILFFTDSMVASSFGISFFCSKGANCMIFFRVHVCCILDNLKHNFVPK